MKAKLKWLADKLGVQEEKLIPFLFSMASLSIPICYMIGAKSLGNTLLGIQWGIIITLISLIFFLIMVKAGYAVFKSLVGISAALTLFIFLAQTYCELETKTPEGTAALGGLFGFGLLFMVYEFFKALYKTFQDDVKNFKEKDGKWSGAGRFTFGVLVLFLVLFIYWIYQVMNPIILSLCIYK